MTPYQKNKYILQAVIFGNFLPSLKTQQPVWTFFFPGQFAPSHSRKAAGKFSVSLRWIQSSLSSWPSKMRALWRSNLQQSFLASGTTARCLSWAALQRGVKNHHLWCLGLLFAPDSTRKRTTSRCPFSAAMKRGVMPWSVMLWSQLAPDSTRNRTISRCPFPAAMKRGVMPWSVALWSLLAPDSTRNRTISRCPFSAAMKRGVAPVSVLPWSLLAPDSTRNRTTSRCPFEAATTRGVAPVLVMPWSLLAPDSTRNRTMSRCPFWAAMKRGVAPVSVLPWSLLAPDSTRNRTISRCPFRAAMKRGVMPWSVVLWSLLAPDLTRNRTMSRCPFSAAMKRGVAPVSVLPWSLLAPDSTRNRTMSRCPFSAAMKRGVAPVSVEPWPLLAPDSTRNRTTSSSPSWAAKNRGVAPAPLPVVPRSRSLLAPASISKNTHLRLPWKDAAHKSVIACSFLQLGFRGWFKCCSRSLSSFSAHAKIMPWSCSLSGGWSSSITRCTTWRVNFWLSIKAWLSSSVQLSWRSRSRKRVLECLLLQKPQLTHQSLRKALLAWYYCKRKSLKLETNLSITYHLLKDLEPKWLTENHAYSE